MTGHPLHPAFVHFAVGLCGAAFLFDAVAFVRDDPALYAVGYWNAIGGVTAALFAAMLGVVDAAKLSDDAAPTLRWHAVFGVVAVSLFGAAILVRASPSVVEARPALSLPLTLEGCGTVSLLVAGYLGGELVYKHGAGQRVTPSS